MPLLLGPDYFREHTSAPCTFKVEFYTQLKAQKKKQRENVLWVLTLHWYSWGVMGPVMYEKSKAFACFRITEGFTF